MLDWWQGTSRRASASASGATRSINTSYQPVATVDAGNGYQADLHEFQITPQGSAFLTAYSLVSADLSSAGGPRNGILQDAIAQEVDIPTGLVMFEWHAYGHVALYDSYAHAPRYSQRAVRLLPHELDLARPVGRRQLHHLLAQHLGGL